MRQDSWAFDKEWPGCFKRVRLVMRSHYHIMGVVRMPQDIGVFDKEWPGCLKTVGLLTRSGQDASREWGL